MDPMDTPPVDHGSDRYDYVEVVGAPQGVAPHGAWWDRMLAMPCQDCRANLFVYYTPVSIPPWRVEIAHDDTCPAFEKLHGPQ